MKKARAVLAPFVSPNPSFSLGTSGAVLPAIRPGRFPDSDQTIPNTIAARKPNDRTMPSTFSLIASCIVALRRGGAEPLWRFGKRRLEASLWACQAKTILQRRCRGASPIEAAATREPALQSRHTGRGGFTRGLDLLTLAVGMRWRLVQTADHRRGEAIARVKLRGTHVQNCHGDGAMRDKLRSDFLAVTSDEKLFA